MSKHSRINYVKNCVEERIGRALGEHEYNNAYARSCKYECNSMQQRINAIIKSL